MKRIKGITALVTICAFLLSACATTWRPGEEFQWISPEVCVAAHTVGGTAAGALAGALIGVASGGGKKVGMGAAAGAVAGGVLAFAHAWGACFAAFTKVKSEQAKGFRETQSEIGYNSQQGTVVKIHNSTIDPAAIAPGDKPILHASYYVMTPKEKEISVTETLTLKIYNPEKKVFEEVGSTSEQIVMSPGKRRATSDIPIPLNAAEGKFLIVFKVATEKRADQMEMPLIITKNQAILTKAKREASSRHANTENQESMATLAVAKSDAGGTPGGTSYDPGAKGVEAFGGKQVVITSNNANLQEDPDVQSQIVATASRGDRYPLLTTVTISGKQWHQIRLSGEKTAWILASLTKVVE